MITTSRLWRLFLFVSSVVLSLLPLSAQSPTLTTVADTVMRADGTPASGTLLISWPAFTTSDGRAVAAGTKSVALASDGSFSVDLVPNLGSTPAGTTYSVVYQLSDGTVKTEFWGVGTSSPETVAQVRTTLGIPTASGGQFATQQYVNSALANVVHLSGNETISGTKQFSVAPTTPSPTQAGQAANKAYVDASVGNGNGGGNGNFVLKSGDTMTGPLTLPANPTSPKAGDDREPGRDPGDQTAVVSEHKVAYGVQDVYSKTGRRVRWSVGKSRRLRDGDGNRTGRAGSGGGEVGRRQAASDER